MKKNIVRTSKNCILCQAGKASLEYEPLKIVRCIGCGLYFRDASAPQADYYIESERYCNNFTDSAKIQARKNDAEERFKLISEITGLKEGRLLDIGANDGISMLQAQKMGFLVFGCEPNKFALQEAKQHNLDIIAGRLEEVFESLKKIAPFNIITLFHVLEHLENPLEALRKITKLLHSNDGWLIIEVPDIESPMAKIYGWDDLRINQEHLFYFSQSTLCLLLLKVGLTPVFLKRRVWNSQGQDLFSNFIRLPFFSELYSVLRITKKNFLKMLQKDKNERKNFSDNTELWISNKKNRAFYFGARTLGKLVYHLNRGDELFAICRYDRG